MWIVQFSNSDSRLMDNQNFNSLFAPKFKFSLLFAILKTQRKDSEHV